MVREEGMEELPKTTARGAAAPHAHAIFWHEIGISPTIQLKSGVRRQVVPLVRQDTGRRGHLHYGSEQVELSGQWENLTDDGESGAILRLRLANRSRESIRITRLTFPTDNGLDAFLGEFDPEDISFLRNGYQSWSTARSYRLKEKPLRPWLPIVSRASSNLANLPSNHPGILSSEMYSVISDKRQGASFLVGQGAPFNEFFYIKLNLYRKRGRTSHFELQYDFGRKMVRSGDSIDLDLIIMLKGETGALEERYFRLVKRDMGVHPPARTIRGWSSWYYYYQKITPEIILRNLEEIRRFDLGLGVLQIDDGYERHVGDWLELAKPFEGRMRELAGAIRDAGLQPGLWIAPFTADRRSTLFREHPDYISRTESGMRIVAGYNIFWKGHRYYGLDITNPRCEEYVRRVVRTIVHDWGFTYLKCDFLFTGALRDSDPKDFSLSRAEILKAGMRLISEEAGRGVTIVGCGMPLSTGIGSVQVMRVGPDTGPYWIKRTGKLLRTGAMVGVRNSLRNVMVRGAMHKQLWLNDPDCIMLRRRHTHLDASERRTHINAIILSGGPLFVSDDLSRLDREELEDLSRATRLNEECFHGRLMVLDLMEREVPELVYNTAGYLGVFNTGDRPETKNVRLEDLPGTDGRRGSRIVDAWSGEEVAVGSDSTLRFERMPPHSSRLLALR